MNGVLLVIAWTAASGGGATSSPQPPMPGRFVVDASFHVDAPAAAAWAVLTDYDHLSSFVPSMKSSRVVERTGPQAIVEQQARGNFLVFRRTVRIRLRVDETYPTRIAFADTARKDFDTYVGEWTLRPDPGGVSVSYHLEALPSGSVPRWLVRKVLKESAADLIDRVRREIERRKNLSPRS
jgi:ribosome-associated toxin RatA of RatAB toxin-antitoxin module